MVLTTELKHHLTDPERDYQQIASWQVQSTRTSHLLIIYNFYIKIKRKNSILWCHKFISGLWWPSSDVEWKNYLDVLLARMVFKKFFSNFFKLK